MYTATKEVVVPANVKLTLEIDDGVNELQRTEVVVSQGKDAARFNTYAASNAAMEELRERLKAAQYKALGEQDV